jgi:alpha-beta hydrolase superfamily lysophospholipase
VQITTDTIDAGDQMLALRRWTPDGDIRLAVQILHGMAEHSARYDALARRLAATGCAVWAHDHRGHGATAREASVLGHFADRNGWDLVVADAWRVHAAMEHATPGVPRVIVAHSMGSFVAQTIKGECGNHAPLAAGIAGVVLCGTSGPPPWTARPGMLLSRLERLRLGRRGRSPLVEHLAFGAHNRDFMPRRTKFDWLSRDPAVVDAYIADPLCGFPFSVQSWIDLLAGLQRLASRDHEARLPRDLPVLLLAGDADPVSDCTRALGPLLASYARAGIALTHHVYPGARHELFNETNRDEVIGDLIVWLSGLRPSVR